MTTSDGRGAIRQGCAYWFCLLTCLHCLSYVGIYLEVVSARPLFSMVQIGCAMAALTAE